MASNQPAQNIRSEGRRNISESPPNNHKIFFLTAIVLGVAILIAAAGTGPTNLSFIRRLFSSSRAASSAIDPGYTGQKTSSIINAGKMKTPIYFLSHGGVSQVFLYI